MEAKKLITDVSRISIRMSLSTSDYYIIMQDFLRTLLQKNKNKIENRIAEVNLLRGRLKYFLLTGGKGDSVINESKEFLKSNKEEGLLPHRILLAIDLLRYLDVTEYGESEGIGEVLDIVESMKREIKGSNWGEIVEYYKELGFPLDEEREKRDRESDIYYALSKHYIAEDIDKAEKYIEEEEKLVGNLMGISNDERFNKFFSLIFDKLIMKILKLEGEGIINCLEQMVEKSREALNKNLLPLNQSIASSYGLISLYYLREKGER